MSEPKAASGRKKPIILSFQDRMDVIEYLQRNKKDLHETRPAFVQVAEQIFKGYWYSSQCQNPVRFN